MTSRSITAISALFALVAALWAGPAAAQQQGAGYVSNLSGPLFVVKADGSRRVLSIQSAVEAGDTLITEDKTYARVRFSDTSEVTLRPGSQFKIETYHFDRQAPEKDNVGYRLFKGALRTVTGLIGKRGNQEAYQLHTTTATIGIRGTVFGVTVCVPGSCADLAPGTYVNVIEGRVAVGPPQVFAVVPPLGVTVPPAVPAAEAPAARPGAPAAPSPAAPTTTPPVAPPSPAAPAALAVAPPAVTPIAPPVVPTAPTLVVLSAGQFGYVPPAGPAVQLPSDPGVGKLFTPPPALIQRQDAPPPAQNPAGGAPQKPVTAPAASDCVVR